MISLKLPSEIQSDIASMIKQRRLEKNLAQDQLAAQSGVSIAVLRKFERTGKVSLESFIKIAFVLKLADRVVEALNVRQDTYTSLDDLLKSEQEPKRKRAHSARKTSHG